MTHLAGGTYDAGGDPALAFDSRGTVFYAGLGFNRTSAPNTVAVNRGTFSSNGALSWSAPTFINQTTSPSTLNDKEWVAADANPASPFRDRVYVSWTRFLFNASQRQTMSSRRSSSPRRATAVRRSAPRAQISGNVKYGQGSRPVVGPDGTRPCLLGGLDAARHAQLDLRREVRRRRRVMG